MAAHRLPSPTLQPAQWVPLLPPASPRACCPATGGLTWQQHSLCDHHANRGLQPGPHSRGRRVDVLAHPLAVCLGALAPWLGLAGFHCAFQGCYLELRLPALLSNLRGEGRGWTEAPWLGRRPRATSCLLARPPSPGCQPPHRGPQTPWWHRCGSPPGGRGSQVCGGSRPLPGHPQAPSSGAAPLLSRGTYLRAVSFGVTLHILHGCQCVKAPNNPAAEGAPEHVPRGTPRGPVPTACRLHRPGAGQTSCRSSRARRGGRAGTCASQWCSCQSFTGTQPHPLVLCCLWPLRSDSRADGIRDGKATKLEIPPRPLQDRKMETYGVA